MGENNQPLVSVLTPVYNGGEYLVECIESVLKQTYGNWEYIIVNNCSTDNTLEIARYYATIDSRIRVVNNDVFLNQVQNLNNSLRQISGDSSYVKMVLADDWIFPDCIQKMVGVAESDPEIGLVSSYRLVHNKVKSDGLPYSRNIYDGREIGRLYIINQRNHFGSETSLLFRADLIRESDPFFKEDEYHTDTSACLRFLTNGKFGFVHQVLSYTRRSNVELSATSYSLKYDTYSLSHLEFLIKYGRYFLTEKEYRAEQKKHIYRHYRILIKMVFSLSGPAVFKYHLREIKKIGISHSLPGMLKAIGMETFALFGNIDTLISSISVKLKNRGTPETEGISKRDENTVTGAAGSSGCKSVGEVKKHAKTEAELVNTAF
jgi:glycosyltransferase involved in cell wall biosynthesis